MRKTKADFERLVMRQREVFGFEVLQIQGCNGYYGVDRYASDGTMVCTMTICRRSGLAWAYVDAFIRGAEVMIELELIAQSHGTIAE